MMRKIIEFNFSFCRIILLFVFMYIFFLSDIVQIGIRELFIIFTNITLIFLFNMISKNLESLKFIFIFEFIFYGIIYCGILMRLTDKMNFTLEYNRVMYLRSL